MPFKSLRYRPGRAQVWGLQVRRLVRWKNEYSYLTPIPAGVGMLGTFQSSLAATLVDLEAPEGTRTLELKPYAIADLVTDRTLEDPIIKSLGGDGGLDVKLGVTRNLTADLTLNTDFAQVEADEQQVNLTRFSLFFPEKREFFLENQGLFAFGGAGTGVFGADGTFSFYDNLSINTYWARSRTPGGRVSARHGSFYGGEKTSLGLDRARLKVTPKLSVEPDVSFNWITLPEGRFNTELVTTRTTYTVTPRMFVGALVQYNSSNNSLGANIRLLRF